MWILFVAILNNHSVVPIATAEFINKDNCLQALVKAKTTFGENTEGFCVWSGD